MSGRALPTLSIAMSLLLASGAAAAQDDGYAGMLSYLDNSRIDGTALSGTTGAVAANVVAGDLNQQANLRAFASGDNANVTINAQQLQSGNTANAPGVTVASIGWQALNNSSGLISINQASGTGNAELNAASVVLAQQGIREASSDQWFADTCACAEMATPPGQDGVSGTRLHAAAVEASAMQGTRGVVQLNQIAGSGNSTANLLQLEVGPSPR